MKHRAISRMVPTALARLMLVLVSAILAIAVTGIAGCERSGASSAPARAGAMPVSVVKVREADVPLTGSWVGTLDGYVNAQIQPQVTGYLVHQNYREGSPVGKDEVLFQIDPRP